VKVLSLEIFYDMEVDAFCQAEDKISDNGKARYRVLHRDLRPCHVLRWNLRKLGRSFVFLLRYVGTSQQRRELTKDAKEVGLIDSTQSVGKPHTRESDQQCSNWFRD